MANHYAHNITLAFAGKRSHEKLERAREKLTELFRAFGNKFPDTHIRLLNGLADGADQIAAEVFLDVFGNEFEEKKRMIGAILPFAHDDYRKTISHKKKFDELLQRCDQQLFLDGKYETDDQADAHTTRNKAYQQQGMVLGRLADIFIAVAPKDNTSKVGGTIESALSVLALKKPVILLNLSNGQFYLYETLEEWFAEKDPIDVAAIPEILSPDPDVTENITLEKTQSNLMFKIRSFAWRIFDKWIKGKEQGFTKEEKPLVFHSLHQLVNIQKAELDTRAKFYQLQYRGGYIFNYVLALAAIALAVTSLIIFSENEHLIVLCKRSAESLEATYWIFGLGFIKLLILIILVRNTKNINKNEYNKKAIDYRYAAERLRINSFMSIIGILRSPNPSLGNHSRKHFAKYRGESIYQYMMAEALVQPFKITITKQLLQDMLINFKRHCILDQCNYHTSQSSEMKSMDNRLQSIPEKVALGVMGIVAIDLVLAFLLEIIKKPDWPWGEKTAVYAAPILIGLTAFLPAIVTTLNSIHFQSESHRLMTRSQLMVSELLTHSEIIDRTLANLKKSKDGSEFFEVLKAVDNTASLLIDEVAEWSLIYEKRVYDQG